MLKVEDSLPDIEIRMRKLQMGLRDGLSQFEKIEREVLQYRSHFLDMVRDHPLSAKGVLVISDIVYDLSWLIKDLRAVNEEYDDVCSELSVTLDSLDDGNY